MAMVRALYRTFTIDGADGEVRISAFFAWQAWPVLGTLARLMMVPRLRTMLAVGLRNLRDYLEVETVPGADRGG